MCTSCPHACIVSPPALKGAFVRSWIGRPSSSARIASTLPESGPIRAIRPVPATVVHATGSASATIAAVRSSWWASSGCSCRRWRSCTAAASSESISSSSLASSGSVDRGIAPAHLVQLLVGRRRDLRALDRRRRPRTSAASSSARRVVARERLQRILAARPAVRRRDGGRPRPRRAAEGSSSRIGGGGSSRRTPSSPARTIAPSARYGFAAASAPRYSRRSCAPGSPSDATSGGMRSSVSRLRSPRHAAPALQRCGDSRSAETGLGAQIALSASACARTPAAKLAPSSLRQAGREESYSAARPSSSSRLRWMCTPLPACAGSSSGVKVARAPLRRATSRTTSRSTTARSAAASPSAGATGISNWCAAYSGMNRSGAAPASRSAPMTCDGNGSARRCASSENGSAAGASSSSWNSCSKLATTRSPVALRNSCRAVAQERPRAALPRAPVGLDDVAEHELQRARVVARRRDAHVRIEVGQQAQIAGRAERVGLGQRADRRERVVRRHPADAAVSVRGELGRGQRAPAHDRAEVAADQRDELARAHVAVSAVTEPLSQMPSSRPSDCAPAAHGRRVGVCDYGDHAAGRHAGTLQRPREPLARLDVHAAAPERRIRVGDRVHASAGPARARDHADEVPDVPVGRRAVVDAVEQVVEQLLGAWRAAPQVARGDVGDQRRRVARAWRADRTGRRSRARSTGPA